MGSDPVNDIQILIDEFKRDAHAITDVRLQTFLERLQNRLVAVKNQRQQYHEEIRGFHDRLDTMEKRLTDIEKKRKSLIDRLREMEVHEA